MLLSPDDPPPVCIVNPRGSSAFLLIGDHAGNRRPKALGSLGVSDGDMQRHIAWDIGIAGLGEILANTLDAVFIRQAYSRLVIDCNRDPCSAGAMPALSDGTVVPGNQTLTSADREARIAEIHTPYQAAIAAELARRDAAGRATILVSLHSFTPSMQGFDRPWHIGILHSRGDAIFARNLLGLLVQRPEFCVGDNQPYAMDSIDYTVPFHAFDTGRPYVEIEIRQDLLAETSQQAEWSNILAALVLQAAQMLDI